MNLARDKSSLELSWNPCLRSGSRMRSEAWGEVGFRFVGTRAASQGVGVGNKTADTSQAFTVGPGSVQFSCSIESDSSTPWTAACQVSPSSNISRSLLKLMSIQPSHPLLPPFPPAQSFLASRCFPISQLFTSSGQSNGASASASDLQGWFPLGSWSWRCTFCAEWPLAVTRWDGSCLDLNPDQQLPKHELCRTHPQACPLSKGQNEDAEGKRGWVRELFWKLRGV